MRWMRNVNLPFWQRFALAVVMGASATAPAWAQYKPYFSSVREVVSFHVNADASSVMVMEITRKVETAQGISKLGEQKVSYNSTLENLEVLEAYTVLPDGTRVDVEPDKIRTQDSADGDSGSIYSDAKDKVIIFPKVAVGSLIHYKVRSEQHTPTFTGHFEWSEYFNPHRRYALFEAHLSHDAAIDMGVSVKGMQGGRVSALPSDKPNTVRYKYSFSQDTAHPGEEWRVDLSDFAPHFSASTFKSYADVGRAYQERAKPKTVATPEIIALAQDLTKGATTEREKVKRLYHWVAQNIRYVGIYLGAGGVVPHDAASILSNRYGDCKDHVVLLESMLRVVGIESSPALINSERAYLLPTLPSSNVFDHVITYIPSMNLFLDSTTQFAPMGTLPSSDMNKPVVITATGHTMHTPADHPSNDYTQTRVSMRMRADGSIQGTSSAEMRGQYEVAARSRQFGNINRDPRGVINRMLDRFQESGTGRILPSDATDFDKPFLVEAEFVLDPVVNVPGPSAMAIPTGVAPGKFKEMSGFKPPPERRFPVVCGSYRHQERIELAFLPGTQIQRIPKGVRFNLGPIGYESTYVLKGKLLTITRELQTHRKAPTCNAQGDRNWERFNEVLMRDMRQQVFFR